MKSIIYKCPFYIQGDCVHASHDLLPGFEGCDGNCYEEKED